MDDWSALSSPRLDLYSSEFNNFTTREETGFQCFTLALSLVLFFCFAGILFVSPFQTKVLYVPLVPSDQSSLI